MIDPTVLFVRGRDRPGDATTTALERSGLEVITADNPVDAVQVLTDAGVDCVAIAPPLAEPGSAWFAERVHSLDRSVPILLVGRRDGVVSPAVATRAADHVAAEDVAEIPDRVRSLVADRRAERAIDGLRTLGDRVRDAMTALPEATDRTEVERAVYEALAGADRYRSVWVGATNPDEDAIRLRFPAPGHGPDEVVGPDLEVSGAAFVDRAIETGAPSTTDRDRLTRSSASTTGAPGDVAADHRRGTALAVPLVSGESTYGVVVLETNGSGIDASERTLLGDLGELAGRAIDRLEGSEREEDDLRRFAEGLAHEFRNTLGIATTHLELGREGDEEALDVTRDALDELERTVDGMLSLATGVEETTTRELEEIVTDVWEHLETADAELVVEDSAAVEADHDLAARLFSNLLGNAVEHGSTNDRGQSDDDPAVTVRVGTLESGFYVEDDGRGVSESERDRVFEWGYANGRGPGVGLGVVAAIAEAHGWSVDVSDGRDDGARFEVTDVRLASD